MEKPSKTLELKSKNMDAKTSKGAKMSSSSRGVDLAGNGVRVSVNGVEGVGDNVSGAGGPFELGKSNVFETANEVKNGGDDESGQKMGSLLDGENEVAGDGADSDGGVSLLVDVSSEMRRMGAKERRGFGEKENGAGGVSNENEEKLEGNIREMSEFKDGDEEDLSDGEYEFCVGDFVWGKIKSYPWWPGQVYDPSDASEYALKVKQRNRILVAYFDGTFAWCHPSQLKPFVQNFDELSKESSSKNFVNAMDKALEEIGRLVQLKMTCSCVSKESMVGLARPLAINSGIKQEVLVPDGGIAKLWNYLFDPLDCLTQLKHVAQGGSVGNMLELTELKCWLSSFFRLKVGYPLSLYHEPQPIPGLEDKGQHLEVDMSCDSNTFEVRKPGPLEEEWHASLERPNLGQTDQSSMQKCNGSAGNGQNQKRKQKSIAEIMEGDVNARAKNDEVNAKKERKGSANPATSSGRKKKKGNDEANGGSSTSSRPKRRRVRKLLETTVATETPNVEEDDSDSDEEIVKVPLSSAQKKGSGIENDASGRKGETSVTPVSTDRKKIRSDDAEAKNQMEKGFMSRERKKSKYLSPPYTNIDKRQSKKDIAAESFKVSNETAQLTRPDSNLVGSGSSATLKRSYEVGRNPDSVATGAKHETNNSSLQTENLDQNKSINATKVQVSTNEVLSGILSTALDVYALKENNSLDGVEEFLSQFRSSVYSNGSDYEKYNKSQPGRKRKTPGVTESGPSTKSQTRKSGEPEPKQAAKTPNMGEAYRKANMNKAELKQAVGVQGQNRMEMETGGKAVTGGNLKDKESSACILATFGPGASLPSKDDLIRIYGKFGSLNKEETDMYYNNHCARIVFLRRSEADVAFNSSQLVSPFGASKVKFEIRYPPSPSKSPKRKQTSNAKRSAAGSSGKSLGKESASESADGTALGKESASTSAEGKESAFRSIKRKLEKISSELENARDGKICLELKAKLEIQVNALLEEVNGMAGFSSS